MVISRADGAISLSTSTENFQSHPIGLFYVDSASGKLAQIGAVQSSVGILYRPNIIVFSNAIPGLADVMLVWAKNGFEQNVVLKKNLPPPSSFSMSSSSTTLQFWTALDNFPTPQQQRAITLDSGLVDHMFYFQACWFPVGSAFAFGTVPLPPEGQAAQVRPIDPSTPGTVQVAKSLVNIAGSSVLIEEVNYTDLLPLLSTLPQASLGPKPGPTVEFTQRGQFLPTAPVIKPAHQPMQIASAPYSPQGVTLDYWIKNGTASSFTFTNATYLITNSFTVSPNTATFSNNACIKFGTNAYLLVGGPVIFPSSGAPVVLTSSDDNTYGDIITNVGYASTANPGYAAKPALWLDYQSVANTVQNVLVRWAQQGIEFTEETGGANQNLNSSVFQDCTTGVYLNIPNATLNMSGDTYCNVATPLQVNAGFTRGSITKDCGVVSVAMVNDPNRDLSGYDTNKNSQTECSFAVLDSTNIVAAFMSTHLSECELGNWPFPGIPSPRMTGWAVSTNAGTNFADKGPILPISTVAIGTTVITNGASDTTHGDAGDTTMAYDSVSNIVYLLVNPSREPSTWNGFRLWSSTDRGQSFNSLNMDVPGGGQLSGADKPMIKVNPTTHSLYVAGQEVTTSPTHAWAAYSTNGGAGWYYHSFETSGTSGACDIAIAADGTVYFVWLRGDESSTGYWTNFLRYAWLSTNFTWSSVANIGSQLHSTNFVGDIRPLRFNGTDANDYFNSDLIPRAIYANRNIYITYADLPSTNNGSTDRGDIFLIEAAVNWSTHALALNYGPRKVNNDGTQTDQWDPSIAANPSGTELFIGYYSRQNDPSTNSWIMAYGAKTLIANGLALATFDCFPISTNQFQPMFAGTNYLTNTWTFDIVWPASCLCLDTNAMYAGSTNCIYTSCTNWPGQLYGFSTTAANANFQADDYTWSTSDSNYFYFTWCDRSRINGTPPHTRPDADIKFAKIKQ